jgi:hypothetical protein
MTNVDVEVEKNIKDVVLLSNQLKVPNHTAKYKKKRSRK